MSSDPIRAALERLVELDDGCTADHWHAAITAARAALDAATEGQPSDQEIADVFSQGCRDLSRSYEPPFLGGARAIFARWGRPAAPPEGKVGELVDELELMANQAATACQFGDAMTLSVAATLLSQLSAAAPAVVPDGPAVPFAGREPASVTPAATGLRPLSPAAQAVLDAYGDFEPANVDAMAAALRAVADQVVSEPPDCGPASHDYNKGAEDRQRLVRFRLLAIAAELEGTNG